VGYTCPVDTVGWSCTREDWPHGSNNVKQMSRSSYECLQDFLLLNCVIFRDNIYYKGYWSLTMDDLRETRGAFCI